MAEFVDPKRKLLTVNTVLAELREKCGLSRKKFSLLLGIGSASLENIEGNKAEAFLRTAKTIQTLTNWSLEWIINGEKIRENDGIYDFFLQVVDQFKKNQDVNSTLKYAIDKSKSTNRSIHINGNGNQVFQKEAIGNNFGSGKLSIGSVVIKSQLTEEEKIAIIEQSAQLKSLTIEMEGLKKLLEAKEEIISALKDRK